jgi:hypothetical protein
VSAASVVSIAFDAFVRGRIFFASSTAGLMVSTDSGATLRSINTGFANRNLTALAGSGFDLYVSSVYEAEGGLYRSSNYGFRWTHAASPVSDQLLMLTAAPGNANVLWGAGYHSLLESVDSGKSWQPKKSPPGSRITAMLATSAKDVLVATDRGLFRTSDGVTWIQCAAGQVVALRGTRKMFSALTLHGAMVSGDGGVSWETCAPIPVHADYYSVDTESGPDSATLLATSAGVFRSEKGCSSWLAVSDGLQPETATLVMFHPTHDGEAFASQGGRIFHSLNGGRSWLPLDDDAQGNSGPSSLVVLPAAPDLLFALYPRRGVFSTSIKEK